MKKFALVIAMILLAILVVSLTACSGGGGTNSIYGKYYEYENGTKNPDSYVELKRGNKWTDGTDSGEFTTDGSSITLLSDGEEFLTGTIENGVLSLELWGMPFATYYKDGAYPSNYPDEEHFPTDIETYQQRLSAKGYQVNIYDDPDFLTEYNLEWYFTAWHPDTNDEGIAVYNFATESALEEYVINNEIDPDEYFESEGIVVKMDGTVLIISATQESVDIALGKNP